MSVTRLLGWLRTPNSFAPVARTMSTLSAKLTTLEKSCSAANSRRWLSRAAGTRDAGEGCWQGQQLVNCIGPPPTSERIARPAPPPADEEGIARRLCQNVRHALKSSEAFANVFGTN